MLPPRPVDFKLSCVHCLESTPHHSLVEAAKPSGLRHVFPRPRSRSPSASSSYVVVAEITTVFCFDQHPCRSIRLSSPTQPNYLTATMLHPASCPPCTTVHCLDALCMHDPATTSSRLLRALYARRLLCPHALHLDQLDFLLPLQVYLILQQIIPVYLWCNT